MARGGSSELLTSGRAAKSNHGGLRFFKRLSSTSLPQLRLG